MIPQSTSQRIKIFIYFIYCNTQFLTPNSQLQFCNIKYHMINSFVEAVTIDNDGDGSDDRFFSTLS